MSDTIRVTKDRVCENRGAARVSGAIKTRTDTQLNVTPSISQRRGATKQAASAQVLAQEESRSNKAREEEVWNK